MKISIVQGDITQQDVDAIVNAAHPSLMGGGGVDGAIHKATGWKLADACRQFPVVPKNDVDPFTAHVLTRDGPARSSDVRCPVGAAVMTPAFNIPAKMIIHTVGPLFPGQPAEDSCRLLEAAYENSLRVALDSGARSVAFPGISVGVFGFPMPEAASIAVRTVTQFLAKNEGIEEVVFVVFDPTWGLALSKVLSAGS